MTADIIHRFSFVAAPIRGEWVRLDETLSTLFARSKPYPPGVRQVLAEMLAAISLLADGIKFRGAVALQARGSGPVTTVLAECREQHLLRGIARWEDESTEKLSASDLASLLGDGQLVVSLLPDPTEQPDAPTYQGIVDLAQGSLAEGLEAYFANSEQLPTRLFLAFDDQRVTGLLLQRLPAAPTATRAELDEHGRLWQEAVTLAATLQPQELARWEVEELLGKLFHEHALTLQPGRALRFSCTCSSERAERMLAALPKAEILELLAERGALEVTCEICGTRYEYDQIDAHALYEPTPPRLH